MSSVLINRWDKLVLCKCPYYSKQSRDSMQSLSKYLTFFHRSRANNPKIYMEPQKTLNSPRNFEKREQGWRYHAF